MASTRQLLAQAQLNFQQEAIDVLPGVDGTISKNPGVGMANLIGGLLSVAMTIAGLLLLLYLIWGSIEWITAAGDKGKIDKARERITGSITGMLVLSASIALFLIIQSFLGLSILRFTGLWNPDYGSGGTSSTGGGTGGSTGGGTGGSQNCTPSTTRVNDGAAGKYCKINGEWSAAMVRCNEPDNHLPNDHYDPCYCLDGGIQESAYDFDAC